MGEGMSFESETMKAIYDANIREIGNAYVKARDELMRLRYQNEQMRRFFKYDPAARMWVAEVRDSEMALLNLAGWFRAPTPAERMME